MPELTDHIVRNGIYIDFEGKQDEPPILLGSLIDGHYKCVFFNNTPSWKEASEQYDGAYQQYVYCLNIEDYLETLVEQARDEDRRIFAYSQLEYETINKYVTLEQDLYININKRCYVKNWRRDCHPIEFQRLKRKRERERRRNTYGARTIGNRLIDYYKLAGGHIPTSYGKNKVTTKIISVENSFNRHSAFKNNSKKHFGSIVSHNNFDCKATYLLARLCAEKAKTIEDLI